MNSLRTGSLAGYLFLTLLADSARATVYYWDPVGTTVSATMPGTWETTSWAASSNLTTSLAAWPETGVAALFCAGPNTTGAFTVTMNSTHTVAGVFNGAQDPPGCSVTLSGAGGMVLPASTAQGFNDGPTASTTINVPIAGSGAIVVLENSGHIFLNGTNTQTGGTSLGYNNVTFTGTASFNNSASFGAPSAPIAFARTGGTLAVEGTSPLTIPNPFVTQTNGTLNIIGNPAGVTFSGAWNLTDTAHQRGQVQLDIGGSVNNVVTISGIISGTNGFGKSDVGILVLSGANTFGTVNTTLGSTAISGGTLVLANTNGSATGVSGIVVANTFATLTGSGATTGTVDNAGNISATNLAGGTATLTTGAQTWEPGSVYQWAINNTGWDQLTVNGSLAINANSSNPMTVNIISLGTLSSFNNAQDYSWLVLHSTAPPMTGFSIAAVTVNSAAFANALGSGAFSVSTNNTASGGDLFVNFVHPPVLSVSNVLVIAGSNAVFFASNSVVGSIPATAAYSWKSNNVTLTDNARISGSATPTLTIANAQSSDQATYTVVAVNAAGTAFVSAMLTVTAASTSVAWTNPVPIPYGTPLGSTQLDAMANVPGTFAYMPPAGTILNTGANTLSVIFTPTDTLDYASATNTVSEVVLPTPLTVTASNAARPFGAANPVLTGTIAGLVNGDNITAAYSCSATSGSPVGSYPIIPTLVDPNNRQTNYTVSLVNGTLSVGTVITWTNPSSITYGTPLSTNQLNATASVPGNFVYNPTLGTVLNIGNYSLSLVFTPTDTTDYATVTNTVSLAVSPALLTVTASNASRQAGATNPTFTGTITGLANGDNISATYSTTATLSSPAGAYPIMPALVDPNNRGTNYTVSQQNGVFTITPIPPVTASTPNLIPLPVTLQTLSGVFTLCPTQPSAPVPSHALMQILVDSASQQTGQYLAAALFKSTGYQFQIATSTATNAVRQAILITTSNALPTLGAEGYELTLAPDSVVIRAPTQGGTFYGVQSLLQLLPPQIYSPTIVTNVPWVAPCVYIQDQPRFPWRGVMVDVARHFIDKQQIKQILDTLPMHKLNTFHWHLVDDNGWRIEITNYPALTTNSAWRNGMDYNLSPRSNMNTNAAGQYGGFYTQSDIREIVAYAQERHITIIPEIEMPCHSTAGLAAYPQFGCGNPGSDYQMDYDNINYNVDLYSPATPGTFAFLEEVLTEVMALFPSPYIHCGGDEVKSSGDTQWNTYTPDKTNMQALGITPNGSTSVLLYQYWFSTNISAFLQSKGRMMMGWDDVDVDSTVTNMVLDSAETGSASRAVVVAEAGLPVIMSPSSACYINYIESSNTNVEPPFVVGGKPSFTSLSTVYNFEPIPSGLPAQYNSNIIGAKCNLWAEYVPSFKNFMFKLYPRMCAMAEVGWSPKASKNYSSFTARLAGHEQRLAQMGVNYDHEAIPQIATWGPTVSAFPTTNYWDITTNVTTAGEIDVNFVYGSGAKLSITSVALLVNGVQVDIDVHNGLAEAGTVYNATEPFTPIYTAYIVNLPETVPGATYTIEAVMAGSGGTTASGVVYLPNWN